MAASSSSSSSSVFGGGARILMPGVSNTVYHHHYATGVNGGSGLSVTAENQLSRFAYYNHQNQNHNHNHHFQQAYQQLPTNGQYGSGGIFPVNQVSEFQAVPSTTTTIVDANQQFPQQHVQRQNYQYQVLNNGSKSRSSVSDLDDDNDTVDSTASETHSKSSAQIDQSVPSHTRKRRRGVIEKRRRDRINSSLAELRRLVPSAFEKQGSQKLEKAEILQMTVEHLRFLNSRGFDALWCDPQRFAAEYHSMGFRVCASEVDVFLSKEGVDLQDPLRLRLMSHLQCFGAQRQSAFNAWTPNPHSHQYHIAPGSSSSSAHLTNPNPNGIGQELAPVVSQTPTSLQ